MGGTIRNITGQSAAKRAERVAREQQEQLKKEEESARQNAEELAQEQSRKYRDKQYRGIKSLVDTSEIGSLGQEDNMSAWNKVKKKIKKTFKTLVNPRSMIGNALGDPTAGTLGLALGYMDEDKKEQAKKAAINAENDRKKAVLEEERREEERRKKKLGAMEERASGLASLIGGGGNTLGQES